jgi:hypothetical protein
VNKIRVFRIIAFLMGLHFCGVSVYTHEKDSIAIESESDTDSEGEDSKKEHKLLNIHSSFEEFQILQKKGEVLFTQSTWNVPHIEISSPPPELV